MAVDIQEFARLHDAWQRFSRGAPVGLVEKTDSRGWADRFAGMQLVQSEIAARGAWTHGHSDFMAVLGIARREVANCRALRWLLDPLARHGIGAGMVNALAEAIGANLVYPHRARVEAEVSRARSRADVVLTGAGSQDEHVMVCVLRRHLGPHQAVTPLRH